MPSRSQASAAVVASAGALVVAGLHDPRANTVSFTVLVLVWGAVVAGLLSRTDGPARQVVLLALVVRLPLLTVAPTLSDDAWRYVWEGRAWLHGLNPFVHPPDDPIFATLRDSTWEHVNHREVPSIYPPFAQLLFVLVAPFGFLGWRLLSTAGDLATVALLSRRTVRGAWLWALLPLPALESAVSGHLEGVGVTLMVAAVVTGRGLWAWLGAMTKLLPGVLLVLEPRRRWPLWAALTLLVAFPIVRPTGFEIYRQTWAFNGSLFPLAERLFPEHARPLLQLAGALTVLGISLRSRDPARIALWTTGAFVCLSPTVHPWYVLWPLAAALLNASSAWIVLGITVPGAYMVLGTWTPEGWTESIATRWWIYLPFYAALLWEGWRRLTRAGPAPVG